jgi:hypothetical protein
VKERTGGGRELNPRGAAGCCDELDLLLHACQVTDADTVILVGDLVNKGPKSQQVRGFHWSFGCFRR